MTRYRVPIKFVFDGAAYIEAESEENAEEIAVMQLKATDPAIYSHGNPAILDFVVNPYTYAERRDNESIEEVEDD